MENKHDKNAFKDFVKRTRKADVSPGENKVVGDPGRKFCFPAQYPRETPGEDGTAPDQATEKWLREYASASDEEIEKLREEQRAVVQKRIKDAAPAIEPDEIPSLNYGGVRTQKPGK
ncbi:MAG: hypothetical protein KOO63_00290 [Bacteroidales bacterium]|nr:hypothetical protein [Candidatus Latescibacterota bacterium]